MKPQNRIFDAAPVTIFTIMSALANEFGAINLGQGFPDEEGPLAIRRHAAKALLEETNQYPPMRGVLALRQAVAGVNKRFYGIAVDPEREVLVTSGATEALADCFFGIINPGDEVIIFEPAYDSYRPMIELAGGRAVPIRLEPPHFELPLPALKQALSAKTKLIVINSPMNPCGKVFSDAELGAIAQLCVERDVYALCDEVYEHILFDGRRLHPLMQFPGMSERTARIGSAGKTFALTGWKVGYVTARASLLSSIANAHQFVTFTTPPALQSAVAFGLGFGDEYFAELTHRLQAKRDLMMAGLTRLGFQVSPCHGTYFLSADFSAIQPGMSATELCHSLVREAKVAAIPLDAFYTDDRKRPVLRFCFCKREDVLETALTRLESYLACAKRAG